MTSITQKLDTRYGRTPRGRVRWGIGAAIGVAVVLVVVYAWMTYASTVDDVDADTTGFALIDEHSVVVEFQVTSAAGRSLACIIEAQDVEHGIVGWKVVEYPATDETARAFREAVPTTAEATTGLVNACWVT